MAKLIHTIHVNAVKNAKVNLNQLSWFTDVVLSNPINKRYRSLFEGRFTLLQVFNAMTETKKDTDLIKISNGTKQVELTVKDWVSMIKLNLSMYNSNPESEKQNVWIKVDKKNIARLDVQLDTLD